MFPFFVLLPPFSDSSVPPSLGWGAHSSHFFPSIPLLRAHARIHYIVCANCLHSFTDGGEGLKIRRIGVKAKSEDIEVKSKGRKGESGRCEVFFCEW